MKIRLAKPSDYDDLIKLYSLFVGVDRFSQKNNDSFKIVLENQRNFVYVALDEDRLIGFATLSIRDVIRYPRPIAELDEIFILEEYRKHGVGKNLMKIIEEKAVELDCQGIFIESNINHTVAHKFYETLGYENKGYQFIKALH